MSKTQKKLIVRNLTTNFRAAVNIETCEICMPKEGQICIKNKYVGINADDINVTKGREFFCPEDLPFGCGSEGIGNVVAVGKDVKDIEVGDPIVYIDFMHNAFAEYTCVSTKHVYRVPAVKPEYLVLCNSGISAMVAVEEYVKLKKGEKLLITGASGGLGHLAVQLAKNIGCYVVATCSLKEKEPFLKGLGCDRIINLKDEDLDEVLMKEFPNGLDVIWETVGGPIFEICLRHISNRGRLVIMGGTSGYQEENRESFPKTELSLLREILFYGGASVIGGSVDVWTECWDEGFRKIMDIYKRGEIKTFFHTSYENQKFIGMEGIIDAMEHLYRGKHTGKVLAVVY